MKRSNPAYISHIFMCKSTPIFFDSQQRHGAGMLALNPILNYVEFRTNPEPYVVRGVVQGLPARRELIKAGSARWSSPSVGGSNPTQWPQPAATGTRTAGL